MTNSWTIAQIYGRIAKSRHLSKIAASAILRISSDPKDHIHGLRVTVAMALLTTPIANWPSKIYSSTQLEFTTLAKKYEQQMTLNSSIILTLFRLVHVSGFSLHRSNSTVMLPLNIVTAAVNPKNFNIAF